ncbi:YqaA family protein [Methyloversatilis thermotolerans]|uniref:YqaA family protein n=1 Tax=Methyloversatilis thermotolerans TaxID=1346290 RepID=UPI00037D5569|nr:YqaA family protein [Methyloversatilis thermotolerans]
MSVLLDHTAGLVGLVLVSFLSATLLPGGSEAALAALLATHPEQRDAAVLLATVGNTAGGMVSYAMGRFVPRKELPPRLDTLRRHGTPALLLSWVPLIGDALCLAAGWLRLPPWRSALMMALGKGARYVAVASVVV